MLLGLTVRQLLDGDNNVVLELVSPVRVQLVDLLVLLDDELLQVGHESLGRLSVLLRLQPVVLGLLGAILFALVAVRLFLLLR